MKDSSGLYYNPDPSQSKVRVYVRKGAEELEFRLWHKDNESMWDKHGWVPYSAIEAAAAMYKETGAGSDPMQMYDLGVAKTLIRDES